MGGISSCVAWNIDWGQAAEAVLVDALSSLGLRLKELPSQCWDPSTATIGGVRDYLCAHVGPGLPGWSIALLQLNAKFYKKLAKNLSRISSATVLTFMEGHQAAWGYTLWQKGKQLDIFWNYPGVVDEDGAKVRGNPKVLAAACGVPEHSIALYLQPRKHRSDMAEQKIKAYPDDKFDLENHWVRTDLMKKLGIGYPDFRSSPGRYLCIEECH